MASRAGGYFRWAVHITVSACPWLRAEETEYKGLEVSRTAGGLLHDLVQLSACWGRGGHSTQRGKEAWEFVSQGDQRATWMPTENSVKKREFGLPLGFLYQNAPLGIKLAFSYCW